MKIYTIPIKELRFSFSRSSGSGGQNINKLNTRVLLRWNIYKTKSLPKTVVNRFCKKYLHKISEDGYVQIFSQRFRTQARNIADCVEKLNEMVNKVAEPPKKRIPTKPKKSSVEKRLKSKKIQSDKKRMRKSYNE